MTRGNKKSSNAFASDSAPPLELVLVKRGQRHVFRYDAGQEQGMLQSLVDMARDPDSGLDWFDVAVLSHQLGQKLSQRLEALKQGGTA